MSCRSASLNPGRLRNTSAARSASSNKLFFALGSFVASSRSYVVHCGAYALGCPK
jgi:hypothetical protein